MTDTYTPAPAGPAWGTDLAAAFAAAQAEMPDITKGRTANVGQYKYTYADLSDVLGALRPVLAKHGLFIAQNVVSRANAVDVWTTIGHKSGQTFDFGPMSFPAGNTPQTAGSAVTYARRYSLLAAVGLATEDDDGHAAAATPRQRAPRPQEQPQDAPSEANEPEGYAGGRPSATGITAAQMTKLSILLNERGHVEKSAVVAYVSGIVGRHVESRKELSKSEAAKVIDALESGPVPA